MENLDAQLEEIKPDLPCLGNISKHHAVEELKFKCISSKGSMVWQKASRADCSKHTLTIPQVILPKSSNVWLKKLHSFSNTIGFIFHKIVQSLFDVNFQHPQHPVGKSYSLAVCHWKKKSPIFRVCHLLTWVVHHFCIGIDTEQLSPLTFSTSLILYSCIPQPLKVEDSSYSFILLAMILL